MSIERGRRRGLSTRAREPGAGETSQRNVSKVVEVVVRCPFMRNRAIVLGDGPSGRRTIWDNIDLRVVLFFKVRAFFRGHFGCGVR